MSRPTGKRRRLALVADPSRALTADLAWIAWATRTPLPAIARDLARGHYLHALTTRDRRVLAELHTLARADAGALAAWADRWRLPAWGCAWARETITLSGGRYWCPPQDGRTGVQLWGELPPSKRRFTPRQLAAAAPTVHVEAFDWLAAYQLGGSWLDIARHAQLAGATGTSAGDVQRDGLRLARLIRLPVRATRRGRPAQKIFSPPDPNE